MDKKELLWLKKKIYKLTKYEKIQRDLYLRALAIGELQGPPTGYASIDKPWLRYHSEKALKINFEPMSAYELMYNHNKDHESQVMCEYFGKKITYKKVFKKIDLVAKALMEFGVKKNDVVMMSLPNCPEAIYLFYALNKMGCIVNAVDPRYSENNLQESIDESNAKYFFGISVMIENLRKVPADVKIVSVSPFESLPFGIREIAKLRSEKHNIDRKIYLWNEFLKCGKQSKSSNVDSVFEENSGVIICHTGGSTGTPKGVILTNENFNGLIYQLLNNEVGLERGYTFLNILPPFVAMGLDDGLHLAACAGIKQYLIPSVNPEGFPDLVLKYKPNLILCGPIHCNAMMQSKKMVNEDLSFLKLVMFGGGEYPVQNQEEFNEFLRLHGANVKLYSGYGATETASGSACQKDSCYKIGSVGAPYIGCVDAIIDPETQEEICGSNRIGELYISGPTVMQGYYGNRSNETTDVIYTDENNVRWYKTGDLAHFDEEGILYIDGRIKRLIIRRAFKIYPQYIEALILKHEAVNECAVVGVSDPDEFSIPVANIVIKDEYVGVPNIKEKIVEFVDDIVKREVSELAMMAGYNFIPEMPKTSIGKLDFKKLEAMGIIDKNEKKAQKRFYMT